MTRLLDRFAAWFASGPGVWQTAVVTLGLVICEAVDRSFDPHGFWLLYALTVYSAVTQPALAYSGAVQAKKTEQMLAHLEALLDHHGIEKPQ